MARRERPLAGPAANTSDPTRERYQFGWSVARSPLQCHHPRPVPLASRASVLGERVGVRGPVHPLLERLAGQQTALREWAVDRLELIFVRSQSFFFWCVVSTSSPQKTPTRRRAFV